MKVTKESYPALHKAFETISLDSDGRSHAWYRVPTDWEPFVETANATLAQLSADELETFCIAEQAEQEALIKAKMKSKRLNLTTAHVLLFGTVP